MNDVVLDATNDMTVDVSASGVMTPTQFAETMSRIQKLRPSGVVSRKTSKGERFSLFARFVPFVQGDLTMRLDFERLVRSRKSIVSVSGHGHWPKAGHIMAKGVHVLTEAELAEVLRPDAQTVADFRVSVGFMLRADRCEPIHSLPIRPSDVTTVPFDVITGQRYAKLSGDKLVYNIIVESSPHGWWACVAFDMQGRVVGDFFKGVVEHGTRITRLFVGSRKV